MTSTYTSNKGFEEPANGDYVNAWNVPINANFSAIDAALGNITSLNVTGVSGTVPLSVGQYRNFFLRISGTLTASVTYQIPAGVGGQWIVENDTAGVFAVTFSSGGGGYTYTVSQGTRVVLVSDGVSIFTNVTASGVTSFSGGSTGLTPNYNAAGAVTLGGVLSVASGGTGSTVSTGTGSVVLSQSPTIQNLFLQASDGSASYTNFSVGNSGANNLTIRTGTPSAYAYTVFGSSGSLTIPGNYSAANGVYNDGGTYNLSISGNSATTSALPVGTLMAFAGPTAPAKWLLCYGQSVSTSTYAALFSVIGYTYGGSGGSFNLPDLRGRTLAGVDNMGGTAANRITSGVSGITGTTLGAAGGDQNVAAHNLSASTSVSISDPGHQHSFDFITPQASGNGGQNGGAWYPIAGQYTTRQTYSAVTGITASASTSVTDNSTGTAANVQPTFMINYIIYAAA